MDATRTGPPPIKQLPPAFVGEQAVYGSSCRGGLPPPPEWWAKIAHPLAPWPPGPVNLHARPANIDTAVPAQPVHQYNHYYPMEYDSSHAAESWQAPNHQLYVYQPPFHQLRPHPTCTQGPNCQVQIPIHSYATNPPPRYQPEPDTNRPSWADMSEDVQDELPSSSGLPNLLEGKGRGKGKKPKKGRQ